MRRILDKLGRISIPAIRNNHIFRFGDISVNSLGMIVFAIQTPDHIPPISIPLNVVEVDIPALAELDVLDGNYLTADTIYNLLWHLIVISNDLFEIVDK